MTCEHVRTQLTGYLDGELDGDAGTMVRGHLRICESCRGVAADEAVLRDGLRSLPPVDPPNSLWAGVQARLAVEEVAASQRPAWRRVLARWQRWMPAPRVAITGALVAAAAVGVIVWKTRDVDVDVDQPQPIAKTI
ncbi:MAG: zf-HC2 domain-containing protein, partial [Deltaproteobacteria bacterium]|nr:zf-HC2 domain-containing protein [Deltaproteobacteria bacterium]